MKERIAAFLISFLLLVGLLYFSNIGKTVGVLATANIYWIVFGFFLWLVGAFFKSYRWQFLMERAKIGVRYLHTLKVYIAGTFFSNLTPGKIGEPILSVLLKQTENKSISITLPSVFLERVFDILMLIVVSVLGVWFFSQVISKIFYLVIAGSLLMIAFAVGGFYLLLSEKRLKIFFKKIHRMFSFVSFVKKYEKKVEKFASELHESFKIYKKASYMTVTAVFTVIIWSLEALMLFIAFKSLGLEIAFLSAFIILHLSNLIGTISFLPGGIGSSEIVQVLLLTAVYPFSLPQVTAGVILGRLFSFWMYAFVGAPLLSTFKYKYKI